MEFSLEYIPANSESCPQDGDNVRVFGDKEQIGLYCGDKFSPFEPPEVIHSNNTLRIEFHSGNEWQTLGFRAQYVTDKNDLPIVDGNVYLSL